MRVRMILAVLAAMTTSFPAMAAAATLKGHDTKIVLLGTAGGPEVRLKRVQSTTAIIVNDTAYLVDVGDGALRQMAKAGLPQAKVKAIFFTLFSQDRVSGFPSFVSTRWMVTKKEPLEVYGPIGVAPTLQAIDLGLKPVAASSFVMSNDPLGGIVAKELVEGGLVFQDENVKVTALALPRVANKPPVAFAYRFDTPAGSIVFTGATGMRDSLAGFAKGADVLVCEDYDIEAIVRKTGAPQSTPGLRERVMQHMRTNHLDPEQIGTLASAAGVKRVVLHRLEPASDDETDHDMEQGYAAGVRRNYKGPVIFPNDLQTVTLPAKR